LAVKISKGQQMKKLFLFLIFSFSSLAFLSAQDQHFTQFYATPTTLNPALSGAFVDKFRISLIYHDQWRNALDGPYITYAGAMDFRFKLHLNKSKAYKDAIGAGMLFYSDRTPGIDFATNQIVIGGALHKSLNIKNNQFLSAGAQIAIVQRSVNYEHITFQDEWNGTSGYSDPTDEILPENNFGFFDMNVGLNYTYSPNRGVGVFFGAAMHHILEPQISFYYDPNDPDNTADHLMHRKYTGHLDISIPVKEDLRLSPRALVYAQGPHFAAVSGMNARIVIADYNGTALHLGSWVRGVKNEGDFGFDSVIGMVGIEYNHFLIGLSYDANLTSFSQSNNGQGAIELSVAYLGEFENEVVLCPKF